VPVSPVSPTLHVVGMAVHTAPDGTALVATPRGEVLAIGLPAGEVAALAAACDGRASAEQVAAVVADPAAGVDVLAALVESGCLSERRGGHGGRGAVAAVVLADGDAELVAAFGDVARRAGLGPPERRAGRPLCDADLVVTLLAAFDAERALARAAEAAEAGVAWAGFHLEAGRGWLGPLVVAGETSDLADYVDRRRSAAADASVWSALARPPVWGEPCRPVAGEIDWMLGALAIELARFLAGAPCRLLSAVVEADPLDLALVIHPVLPHAAAPRHPLRAGWAPVPERLVDDSTGVVVGFRDTGRPRWAPASFHAVAADVADMAQAARQPWRNDVLCGGTSFTSRDEAVAAALGEAVERYCANWAGGLERVTASHDELRRRGERAVDPLSLVLYSERQYAADGFPFRPFGRDLRVTWARGASLTTGAPTWLPASQVYINWRSDSPGGEPPLHFHNYAGVQAGPSLEFALASGIEELVERDATMCWWANRHPLPALVLPERLRALWAGPPADAGVRAWAIHLDNEFGIPVVAGIVDDRAEGILTVGFAARADPAEAVLKAWGEALVLQEGSHDLDRPEERCAVRELLRRHNQGGDYLKAWRADRSYLDAYRDDFRDVVQLLCQQQINLDPRARARVSPWLDVDEGRPLGAVGALGDRDLSTYQRRLEARGYEVLYADLTTPDVAACGLRVVRVVAPGLVANFPAAFPAWGRDRVREHAALLGWGDAPDEDELNVFPLPYA